MLASSGSYIVPHHSYQVPCRIGDSATLAISNMEGSWGLFIQDYVVSISDHVSVDKKRLYTHSQWPRALNFIRIPACEK
jgi:hypothetical protein